MDPNYGKAYGRMGLAYSCVEKHKEAIECFKKAIVLEPENESYKSNLKLAEEKLASTGISPGPGAFAMPPPGALGGLDLGGLLGNPALMNMATTMLADPNIEQMQQSNPELVDQLRRQMGGPGNPPDDDQNPPP